VAAADGCIPCVEGSAASIVPKANVCYASSAPQKEKGPAQRIKSHVIGSANLWLGSGTTTVDSPHPCHARAIRQLGIRRNRGVGRAVGPPCPEHDAIATYDGGRRTRDHGGTGCVDDFSVAGVLGLRSRSLPLRRARVHGTRRSRSVNAVPRPGSGPRWA